MARQAWMQRLAAQTASGTIFDTYTTAKTVINQQALVPIGGNSTTVGDSYRVMVRGALTTLVTTPGTITFQIMMGPTSTIVAWTSGAIQLNATAHTLLPFSLEVDLTVQVMNTTVGGAVAKFLGMGTLIGVMFTKTATTVDNWGSNVGFTAGAAVSEAVLNVPVTAPAQGTAWDGTVTNIMDFWAGFSVSSASNRVQIHQYFVDSTGGAAGG